MMTRFSITKKSFFWVSIGLVWMVVSAVLFFSHIRFSKQFTGGIEFKMASTTPQDTIKSDITSLLASSKITTSTITTHDAAGKITVLIQVPDQTNEKVSDISTQIQSLIKWKYLTNPDGLEEFAIVGPSIGESIKSSATMAIIFGLLMMTGYMIFAFAAIRDFIQPWILAIITAFTMLFDILSPMGIYGIKMWLDPTAQVDVIFVIVLLTTMWYSINDTIVIFDRIRENLSKIPSKQASHLDYGAIFDDSLRQTMRRSLGTSLSVFFVVFAMYLFGTGDLGRFAFSMMVGVISGSFSSIFLAAPLAYLIMKKNK